MQPCKLCGDSFNDVDLMTADGVCIFCDGRKRFADFARKVGLTRFPDPSGERYVSRVDGGTVCKKIESIDFMDELWNALVKAAGGSDDLLLNRR